MKATLESTSRIVQMKMKQPDAYMPARVWEGVTERGVKFIAFVTRVAVERSDDNCQFEAELKETVAPSAAAESFPLKMIL